MPGLGLGSLQSGGGLLYSKVPGRTDRLPTKVSPESHIIPADVVSGLGQGNTMAGGHMLDHIFKPHFHSSVARSLTPRLGHNGLSKGGRTGHVPVILAGGEYTVPPEVVYSLGGGNFKKGHQELDKFIDRIRKHTIKTIAKLPKPQK